MNKAKMEEDMSNLIKVWISVTASLSYCYFVASKIPKGRIRLISLLPIFYLFFILPCYFSSITLRGTSAFFLTWLANFKLILFSFNAGPLSTQEASFLNFISVASLPIKSKENPSSKNTQKKSTSLKRFSLGIAIKVLLLASILQLYSYKQRFHRQFLMVIYCFHLYVALELVLAVGAALARTVVGFELEPQFNKPYLSTSLQDFWGRRWNLMVTSILRPTVYNPIRRICNLKLGKNGAQVPAVVATFFVSGIMHEIIMYYLTKARPTWEMMWFFILHGICLAIEFSLKRIWPEKWRLPVLVSRAVTILFVVLTGFWLFLPPMLRSVMDAKAVEESWAFLEFLEEKFWNLVSVLKFLKRHS